MQYLDASIFRLINHGLASTPLDILASLLTCFGLGIVPVGAGLFMALAGYLKSEFSLCRAGYAIIASAALAGVLSQIGKHLWDRPRPVMVLHDVRWVGEPLYVHSFPSGHTTTAFAFAFVTGAYYPRLRLPVYVLAMTVGFSRIYLGAHFFTDVLGGAVLGTIAGMLVRRIFQPKQQPAHSVQVEEVWVEN